MPTFPIPAQYIATGGAPGQIPVRDAQGRISGVPVLYSQRLTDEVAQLARRTTPSGFLRPGVLKGTLAVTPFVANRVYLEGGDQGVEVVVDGYHLRLVEPGESLFIDLPAGPQAGSREDLVFLEIWFGRGRRGERTPLWRVRVVEDVSFGLYPEGMNDARVTALSPLGEATAIPFLLGDDNLGLNTDPTLWAASTYSGPNDPMATQGRDGQPYRVVYALPLLRLLRLNPGSFHAETNPSGGAPYEVGTLSDRPDGLWHNAVDIVYQTVDLRHVVQPTDNDILLQKTLWDKLFNRLASGSYIKRSNLLMLDDRGLRGYFADAPLTQRVALSGNLVRHSHFELDSNDDGLVDSWSSYGTSTEAVGQITKLEPAGQLLRRTAADPSSAFGISKTLTGFNSAFLALRVGYTVKAFDEAASADTRLVVELRDGEDVLARIESQPLPSYEIDDPQETMGVVPLFDFKQSATIYVYLKGGQGDVLLDHVDVKADDRVLPVVRVREGSVLTITATEAMEDVMARFAPSAEAYDAVTGAPITITEQTVDALGQLVLDFSVVPASRDIKLMLDVVYPAGSGPMDLMQRVTRAWDLGGFAGFLNETQDVASLSEAAVGASFAVVGGGAERVSVHHPLRRQRGVVSTMRLSAGGGTDYLVPAAHYGRRVLLPVAARVNGTPAALASVRRNPDGTLMVSFAVGVPSGALIELDLALEAPVVVWDHRINGVIGLYSTRLLSTRTQTASRSVQISVPGEARGQLLSDACRAVLVDGLAVAGGAVTSAQDSECPVISLVFQDEIPAGTNVEVVAIVRHEALSMYGLTLAYDTPSMGGFAPGAQDELEILAGPLLVAHTKGTGGVDQSGYDASPFVRNAALDGRPIKLAGSLVTSPVLPHVPIHVSFAAGEPLYRGRRMTFGELRGALSGVQGQPLADAAPHGSVLALLVKHVGRKYLVLATSTASTVSTVAGGAFLMVYEPAGRPAEVLYS